MSAADPSQTATVPADELAGQILAARYRLEARLGKGGMGAVYRAHHMALDRKVAVKVLHTHLTEDPLVAKRFDREALAASKLDHPNCVQMLDAGTTEAGMKYLVMQLLQGRELAAMLDAPMPVARAVALADQILRGLDHAHRRGLVHRDLKPENVFIVKDDDDHDVVKLVDFGIVKLLSSATNDEKLTRAGLVFGTPRYMSPEQAAGGTIDERTDLYAVGVLLYQMLAGKPPFDGDEPGIVLRMHILADPPPLPDAVPAQVREVVMRLLAKSAKDRYASARETRDALEAATVAPDVAAPTLAPPPATLPSGPHPIVATPSEPLPALAMTSSGPIPLASPSSGPVPTVASPSGPVPIVASPPSGPVPIVASPRPSSGVDRTVLAVPAPTLGAPRPAASRGSIAIAIGVIVLGLALGLSWMLLRRDDRAPPIDPATGRPTPAQPAAAAPSQEPALQPARQPAPRPPTRTEPKPKDRGKKKGKKRDD